MVLKRKPHKLTPAARQRRRKRKLQKGHIRIRDGEGLVAQAAAAIGAGRKP